MSKSPDVPVPNVWIWNIDSNKQKFFAAELKAGRLRQGWGDDDRLDLRLIKKKTEQKQPLDEEESAAWNRLNVMIMDWGIKLTDIILVKNTPKWGWYTLAKVIGGYQFDRKAKDSNGDYGHFLNVDPVWEVEKHSAPVAGDLRSSIDNARWPITAAVKRAPEIKIATSNTRRTQEADPPARKAVIPINGPPRISQETDRDAESFRIRTIGEGFIRCRKIRKRHLDRWCWRTWGRCRNVGKRAFF